MVEIRTRMHPNSRHRSRHMPRMWRPDHAGSGVPNAARSTHSRIARAGAMRAVALVLCLAAGGSAGCGGGETSHAGDASTPDGHISRDAQVDGARPDGRHCNNGERVACSCTRAVEGSAMRSCTCDGGAGLSLTLACTVSGDCAVFTNTCVLEPYERCAASPSRVVTQCVAFCGSTGRGEIACGDFLANVDGGIP